MAEATESATKIRLTWDLCTVPCDGKINTEVNRRLKLLQFYNLSNLNSNKSKVTRYAVEINYIRKTCRKQYDMVNGTTL